MCTKYALAHSACVRACVRSFSYTHIVQFLFPMDFVFFMQCCKHTTGARIKRILRYTYYLVEKGGEIDREREQLDFKVLNSNFGECWKANNYKGMYISPFLNYKSRCGSSMHSYSHKLRWCIWSWVNFLGFGWIKFFYELYAICRLLYRWQIWFESVAFCQCYHHRTSLQQWIMAAIAAAQITSTIWSKKEIIISIGKREEMQAIMLQCIFLKWKFWDKSTRWEIFFSTSSSSFFFS